MKKMELYGSLHIPLYLFTLEIKETIYNNRDAFEHLK